MFFASKVRAIYSISIDEKAIISYFFKQQLKKLPLSIKINLDVNFLLFLFLALSKYRYLITNSCSWLPLIIFQLVTFSDIAKLS